MRKKLTQERYNRSGDNPPSSHRAFSYHVTGCCHIGVPKQFCGSWTLFFNVNSFFCSNKINLHRCWPPEWKRSIKVLYANMPFLKGVQLLQYFWVNAVTFGVAFGGFVGFQGSLLYICRVTSWSLRIKSLAIASHCGFLHPWQLLARVTIFSGKFFPLIFSVTVPVSKRSFGWFLHSRVALDTSLWLWHPAPG